MSTSNFPKQCLEDTLIANGLTPSGTVSQMNAQPQRAIQADCKKSCANVTKQRVSDPRTQTAFPLTNFPSEVLVLILTLCTGPDLPALARVCIDFKELTSDRRAKIAVFKLLIQKKIEEEQMIQKKQMVAEVATESRTSIWSMKKLCTEQLNDEAIQIGVRDVAGAIASGGLVALETLDFEGYLIGNTGMTAIMDAIKLSPKNPSGALANCIYLDLDTNAIGDDGMKAFSAAISSGALGSLIDLYLNQNRIKDNGISAFADAIKPTPRNPMGALRSLETLSLSNNLFGDIGMTAFANAIKPTTENHMPLGSLTHFRFNCNYISDPGMVSFSDAISSGALPKLSFLNLARNPGDAGVVQEACDPRGIICM
jgi:hypothetical protein